MQKLPNEQNDEGSVARDDAMKNYIWQNNK